MRLVLKFMAKIGFQHRKYKQHFLNFGTVEKVIRNWCEPIILWNSSLNIDTVSREGAHLFCESPIRRACYLYDYTALLRVHPGISDCYYLSLHSWLLALLLVKLMVCNNLLQVLRNWLVTYHPQERHLQWNGYLISRVNNGSVIIFFHPSMTEFH